MKVTQEQIAEKAGIDRSTVSKILSNNPNYRPNKNTRELVFQIAEEMGYDFGRIHNPLRREHGRFEINASVKFKIVFENGEVFDVGSGVLKNISAGGALLTEIQTDKEVMPLRYFVIELKIDEIEQLKDIVCECEVVHFGEVGDSIMAQVGLRFVNLLATDRKKVNDFVEKTKAKEVPEPSAVPSMGSYVQ